MNRWLFSTNAKDIGTLYLIFAVFAGIFFVIRFMLALNLYICWEAFNWSSASGNFKIFNIFDINSHFRDNTIDFLNFISYWYLQLLRIIYYYLNLFLMSWENLPYSYLILSLIEIFKDIFIYLSNSYDFSLDNYLSYYSLYNSFNFIPIFSSDKKSNVKNSLSYNSFSSYSDTSSTTSTSDEINYTYTDLEDNLNHSKRPNLNLKGHLGYYLAGLIESEGAIIVPKENSKKNTPTVKISFHINDLEFAKKLIKTLGYGSIQMDYVSSNAFTVVIRSKEGLLDLIFLINGKFRTPKINKLYSLIDYINKDITNYKLKDFIVKISLDKSKLTNNSWLSGFTS